jgi:putative hydroxymethylpyrimidine transport system substrate-binding protein
MRFVAALILSLFAIPAVAQDKLTVLLDWYVNPDHGPLFVAQEKGYFKEAGLEVRLIAPSDPNDPPRLVAAKRSEIAISYQPQLHIMTARGLPLVRIGTLVATPLTTLVTLEAGPIRTIKDLKGKKIGYSVGGFETAVLGAMLERSGLSARDVTLINVNFDLTGALLTKRVDAVIGAYRNFELNQLQLKGQPGNAFYPEEHGVPAYDELIFVTHKDRTGDPRMKRFLGAIERATQYIVNYPKDSWHLFIKGRKKQLDNELNRRAWRDTIPRFALRPAALDRARYDRFGKFLKDRGVIKIAKPTSEIAVELR